MRFGRGLPPLVRLLPAVAVVVAAPAAEPGYMEVRLGATCHRQRAEDYSRTGMGRSFFRPAASNTLESYTPGLDFYHAPSDTHVSMIRRGGEYFQRRWQTGFGGKETNVEESRIDYYWDPAITRDRIGTARRAATEHLRWAVKSSDAAIAQQAAQALRQVGVR